MKTSTFLAAHPALRSDAALSKKFDETFPSKEQETLDQKLYTLCQQFEQAEEATREARSKSELCRDYFDDKQLTATEEAELRSRGQPPTVFNEIKPKVKTMLGLEKQTRKDPKAFPRNPGDEESSDAATDTVRYVCDDSRWDDRRSAAAKNIGVEGTGAVKVGFKQTKNGLDPAIYGLAWDRFYYDPASSEQDFEDAKFLGEVVWMDLADAKAKFPDAEDALETTWTQARASDTYDDKPKHGMWADHKRKRVRICEEYYREQGEWMFCIYTKGGFLVEPQASPYLDADDQPECPIKAISLYVDRDNNRYGEVQSMLSPQDAINKRESKLLHITNTRQIRVSPNVAQDAKDVRKELSRPDGVFIGEQGDVEILGTMDMFAGNLQLLGSAREHIHRTGANSAMAGKDTAGQSGKAIALQQMGGMTEAADFLDCIRRLSLAVYRSVWGRARQAWTAERWIRVTDNERNVRFVGLNRPVTVLQAEAKKLGIDRHNMDQADPQAIAYLETLAAMPVAQQVVGIENNVAEMDVDFVVDEGIDTPTIAAEQFDTLTKMLPGMFPQGMPPQALEMLVEASSLRNKDKLIEMLQQGPSPEQLREEQETKAIAKAGAVAEIGKTESETAKNYAQAQAADPQAQMQLEGAKAAHGAQLAEDKQAHGFMLAERNQALKERLAARQAAQRPRQAA